MLCRSLYASSLICHTSAVRCTRSRMAPAEESEALPRESERTIFSSSIAEWDASGFVASFRSLFAMCLGKSDAAWRGRWRRATASGKRTCRTSSRLIERATACRTMEGESCEGLGGPQAMKQRSRKYQSACRRWGECATGQVRMSGVAAASCARCCLSLPALRLRS